MGPVGPMGPNGPIGQPGPVGTQTLFGNDTQQAADGRSDCVLGSVWLSAGSVAGGTVANGQTLAIAENDALFALLGTTYGGDGQTTFRLPDLRSRAPNGLSYWICTEGIFPSRQ
jgi:Phage Tail Collar Domain